MIKVKHPVDKGHGSALLVTLSLTHSKIMSGKNFAGIIVIVIIIVIIVVIVIIIVILVVIIVAIILIVIVILRSKEICIRLSNIIFFSDHIF